MVCIIIFEVKNSALTKILLIINVHTSILCMDGGRLGHWGGMAPLIFFIKDISIYIATNFSNFGL